jgi:hypothetical protein
MTENGTYLRKKVQIWWLKYGPLENFFFSEGNQIFLFNNFNTAAYGGLKNQIFNYFFDRVPQPPALNGSKKHLLGHISSF